MKLPSIQHFYTGLIKVIKRFPIQFILAILAAALWCYYLWLTDYRENYIEYTLALSNRVLKLLAVSNLALALTLAFDLFAERNRYTLIKKWGLRCIALAFCAGLFFALDPVRYLADVYRIAILAFAFHLLVAFAPFTGKGSINDFWQFNKALFLRFLTAVLYSAVLFIGLAIALVAIDGLFNVKIGYVTYMSVFAFITAGFNTIFFLAGLPTAFDLPDEEKSYPKGLKIFTQFVLIPLMTIYLIILLLYEVKIIAIWELPKGLVSSLILGYAVFGILSLLLIYPIKENKENSWIKLFSKLFYIMLIPLIVLLLLAIWKRVGHYGITESRYIILVLALWLTGITLYFLFNKKQNIKIIPISLCIIALLSVYGPQSASSVSKSAQLTRLTKLLKSNKADDQAEQPEVVEYLIEKHGLTSLQKFTKLNLEQIEKNIEAKNVYSYRQKIVKADTAFSFLKITKTDDGYMPQYSFVNSSAEFLNVKGYDYVMGPEEFNMKAIEKNFEGLSIKTERAVDYNKIIVTIGKTDSLEIDLIKLLDEAYRAKDNLKKAVNDNEYFYPIEKMTFTKNAHKYKFTFIITSLKGDMNRKNSKWIDVKGYLLIKQL